MLGPHRHLKRKAVREPAMSISKSRAVSFVLALMCLASGALALAVAARYSNFLLGTARLFPHGAIVFLLIFAITCLILLRAALYIRLQFILCCFTAIATAYGFEAYLWMRDPPAIAGTADQIPEGAIWTVPSMGAGLFVKGQFNGQLYPLGGISSTHVMLCYENGYWAEYDSDEHGFNNPKSLWNP